MTLTFTTLTQLEPYDQEIRDTSSNLRLEILQL